MLVRKTLCLSAGLALAAALPAQAALLVTDTFSGTNGAPPDATKWNTVAATAGTGATNNTTTNAVSGSSIMIVNPPSPGALQFYHRAYLNTANQYQPGTSAIPGLDVTGTWNFATLNSGSNDFDFLQVLTRSDGTPGGTYGETNNGIEGELQAYGAGGNAGGSANNVTATINGRGGNISVSGVTVADNTLTGTNLQNVPLTFDFTDNGSSVAFHVIDQNNTALRVDVTATATGVETTNLVTIHDRETGAQSDLLTNFTISSTPEPASLALLGLGAVGLLARRKR